MFVKHPLDVKWKHPKIIMKWILGITFVSVLITIIITLVTLNYSSMHYRMCSPFVNPKSKTVALKIAIFLVLIMHVQALLIIAGTSINIVKDLRRSKRELNMTTSRKESSGFLVVQIVTLIVSNILCWVASDTIYLTLSFLHKYPIEMIIWTIIVLQSVNSVTICYIREFQSNSNVLYLINCGNKSKCFCVFYKFYFSYTTQSTRKLYKFSLI